MRLAFESGRVVENPAAADIVECMTDEKFAILSQDDGTYIQCAEHPESDGV